MGNVLGGSGGGGTTSTTTTTQELSPEQQRLLSLVIPEAENIIQNPPQLFPGSTIAPRDPLQLQAQQRVLELVGAGGPGPLPQPAGTPQPIGGGTIPGPQIANPELVRLQALLGETSPTQNTPAIAGPDTSGLQTQLQQLNAEAQRARTEVGTSEGDFGSPGVSADLQRRIDALQAQISAAGAGTPAGTEPNPLFAQIERLLAGQPATIAGPNIPSLGGGAGAPAGGQVGQFVDAAVSGGQFLAGGDVLFPESNPALRAATDAAIRPLTENFLETILPGIRGEAITSGSLGGSRQGIAEGAASRGLLRQIGDTSASIQANAFQQSLDAMVKALFAAPQTAQLPFVGPAAIEAVGAQRQQFAQSQLSEQAQRFLSEQLIPFSVAQDVAALAFGIPGGTVTSNASFPSSGSNTLGQILGTISPLASLFGGGPATGNAATLLLG